MKAADALRESLTRQYGPSARFVIDAEIDARLATCSNGEIGREVLDSIETNVLQAVRQGRKQSRQPSEAGASSIRVGGGQPWCTLASSGSAPMLGQSMSGTWAGDTRHVQGRSPTLLRPGSCQAIPPSSRASSSRGGPSASPGAGSWMSRTGGQASRQWRSSSMTALEGEDEPHFTSACIDSVLARGEDAQRQARQVQLQDYRRGLAIQMEEKRQAMERDTADYTKTREAMLRHVDEMRREELAAAERKAELTETMRRDMNRDLGYSAQRKQRDQLYLDQDREDLDRVVAHEKDHAESQLQCKRDVKTRQNQDWKEASPGMFYGTRKQKKRFRERKELERGQPFKAS